MKPEQKIADECWQMYRSLVQIGLPGELVFQMMMEWFKARLPEWKNDK